jgi:hypothetical protein
MAPPTSISSSFLSPKRVEVTLDTADGPKVVALFPMSAWLFFQLRGIAAPVISALAEAMSNDANDVSIEERQMFADGALSGNERIIGALSPELFKARADRKQAAIDRAIGTLLSEDTRKLAVKILVDAMREEEGLGSAAAKNDGIIAQVSDRLDMPTMMKLLKGVAEANEEVLAPFKQALPPKATEAIERMTKAPAQQPPESAEKSAPANESDATPPAPEPQAAPLRAL